MRRTLPGLALAGAFCLTLSATVGAADIWRPIALTGLWGELGLGYEASFTSDASGTTWTGGPKKSIQAGFSGFVLNPRFISWQGDLGLSAGNETDTDNASLRLDILPEHQVPVSVTAQVATGRTEKEFQPVRKVRTEALDAVTLVGAYGQPIILTWSSSDTETVDPERPSHTKVEQGKAVYNRKLSRDHDFSGSYDDLQVRDLLTNALVERQSYNLRLNSRFLYDLITLTSGISGYEERRDNPNSRHGISEELRVYHRENWESALRYETTMESISGTESKRETITGETDWSPVNGAHLTLGGSRQHTWLPGQERWASRVVSGANWNGSLGDIRVQAYGRYSAGPETARGGQLYKIHAESILLTDGLGVPLAERNVDPDTVRIYLPNETSELEPGVDYELRSSGEWTYVVRLPSSPHPSGEEVLADYTYSVELGDKERSELRAGVTATVLSERSSFTVGASRSVVEEQTENPDGGVDTERESERNYSAVYSFADGPTQLTAEVSGQDEVSYQKATIQFAPGQWKLSQQIQHSQTDDWRRNMYLSRVAYRLRGASAFRLDALLQQRTIITEGASEGEDRELQAGVSGAYLPDPGFSLTGSLRYVKDWQHRDHDQVAVDAESLWRRGQLALRLETELRFDVGRDASEGRLDASLVRYF